MLLSWPLLSCQCRAVLRQNLYSFIADCGEAPWLICSKLFSLWQAMSAAFKTSPLAPDQGIQHRRQCEMLPLQGHAPLILKTDLPVIPDKHRLWIFRSAAFPLEGQHLFFPLLDCMSGQ